MKTQPNTAMVLAAGYGKRMRSFKADVPKPLVEVAGRPLIDWSLDRLAQEGIDHVVVNVSYMADKLEAHLANRSKPKVQVSPEPEPMETGGGIAKALPLLGELPFFVLNSDVICLDGPLGSLFAHLRNAWRDAAFDALLLLMPKERAVGYSGQGDFHLLADGTVRRRKADEEAPYIFSGIQLLHPRLFTHAPKNEATFSLNVLYDAERQADGRLPRIGGIVHDGEWFHVGDGAGVLAAEAALIQPSIG